jgi:hypothetical protein
MAGGFGGESKWTEDYVRSLPTAPSVDSLGSTFDPELGKTVRVDRKVYEWFGGDTGGWEEVFSVPSDYSTGSSAAPAEETGSGETSSGIPVMVPPLSTSTSASPVSSNPYYPQLVQEYEAPGLMDYSSYMPADSMFGYEQYQPWTNPNNINDSIFNYQPPTIYASDPRASTGFLATPGGVIEGGYMRPTVGIEAATSSTPSSSIPVGSAGYPQGDPRNPEDRGGPDRPDGYVGADTDTQTRGDLTVNSLYPNQIGITPPRSLYPNQIGITPPNAVTTAIPPRIPPSINDHTLQADINANKARQAALQQIREAEKYNAVTTPLPTRAPPSINDHTLASDIAANQARQAALAAIAEAEKQVAIAGSDHQQERARAMMDRANALASQVVATALPSRAPPSINDHTLAADIAANKAKQDMIGLIAAAEAAQAKGGGGGSSGGGSSGGGGFGGPGGPSGGGHSRR